MKAAVITGNRTFDVINVAVPVPAPGEVRVRLEGCGICASNLPVWEGRPWFQYPLAAGAPGHEGWGTVDAIGDGVESVRVGERVAFLSDRAYAEFDVAKSDALVTIPRDSAPFPGEAVGCAMNIHRRSEIRPQQTVVVIGAGFLGNLLIQLAKNDGARVIAISRREWALELARRCGADELIPMNDHEEIVSSVRDLTGGAGAERVIECIGSQWPLDIATNVIAERGRLVIAGYHQDGLRQVDLQKWNWLGIDVINAHERDPRNYVQGMHDAIAAMNRGTIRLTPLLTHAYPIDWLDRALDDVANRPTGFVKGMIAFA
jgi:threonine dehydrogenase-like Zn-dependent dehydrogenase